MNKEFDELIDKHLKGTLKDEEKQLLAIMLRVPENQLYLAAKIDEKFLDQSLEELADDKMGAQLFQRIHQRINEVKTENEEPNAKVIQIAWYRKKMFRWIAVAAAAVIFVISFGVLFENGKPDKQKVVMQNKNKSVGTGLPLLRNEENKSGIEKRLQLADGSMIVLANQSSIGYYEPFADKREIILKGKAYFKVAKDSTKPFTVISGDISTTALGTEFTVTAFENSGRIVVRLYEGKVVVKPVKNRKDIMKSDVYLLPGNEFIYDSKNLTKVGSFKIPGASTTPETVMNREILRDDPSFPEIEGSWYMFNNQLVEHIFEQLAEMHNVEIIYNKKDLQNLYFIGKFDKSDSVEYILKRISTMNNLTVTRENNKFVISK